MASLSFKQIAQAVIDAGFPPRERATAVAVARSESGGNPAAKNTKNKNGSTDYGLFQINSVHKEILASGNWADPTDNAKMALQVWRNAGEKWTPWTDYKNGRYRLYMTQADLAVRSIKPDSGLTTPDYVPNPPSDPGNVGIMDVVKFFTDPANWQRVAMFIAGGLFLIFGLLKMTEIDNQIAKAIGSGAKLAVTKGVVK